jgi:hypothetical protein
MDLVPCAHCVTNGTCKNGLNQSGCAACQANWTERSGKFNDFPEKTGIICSVCWGRGLVEPSNQKWEYRFPAFLALLIIVVAFSLLLLFSNENGFDKILVFVSTLVGSVTGYYFGGERYIASAAPTISASAVSTPPTAHEQEKTESATTPLSGPVNK